jgi:hypothetical protein
VGPTRPDPVLFPEGEAPWPATSPTDETVVAAEVEPPPDATEPNMVEQPPVIDGPDMGDGSGTQGGVTAPAPDPSVSPMVPAPTVDPTIPPVPGTGGGTDPQAMCFADACFTQASEAAEGLAASRPAPPNYDTAVCDETMACTCSGAGATLTLSTQATTCALVGRFGECLFEPSAYTGCAVGGDECAEACSALHTRQSEEAASSPAVSVRVSACGADGQCRFVLESELGCVLGPSLVPSDCAAADAQVMSAP